MLGATRSASAANLARLPALRRRFEALGADAVVVLGGLDPSYEGTRALLASLRGRLPVLALPGEHASHSGFSAAVLNLDTGRRQQGKPPGSETHGGLVDLSLVRALVHPAASLLGVPGYHLPHHLRAGSQGCGYDAADLEPLARLAAGLPKPRLLLAHGPPRGAGEGAIDRGFGGANLGDPALTRLLRRGGFTFGLFSHLHESAGRATTLDGRPVPPLRWSPSLLLNVGAADATAHEDLRGRWSHGTAAVVYLAQGRARYELLHLGPGGRPAGKQ